LNGLQHGKGIYMMADNTKKVGLWVDGKRTEWLDDSEM
jgi:hypothetical protein